MTYPSDYTPTLRERLNDIAVAHSAGGCHPSYCEMLETIENNSLVEVDLIARLWDQTREQVIENIELLHDRERVEALMDEFIENGLEDVAEHLAEHGFAETRTWLDNMIANPDPWDADPEGWRLGNLEVARDRLNERTAA